VQVLVVNAGSSSLKLRVLDGDDRLLDGHDLEMIDGRVDAAALDGALRRAPAVDAVGHRVVHGGPRTSSALVDDALVDELHALVDLAPLHQPPALAALEHARQVLPRAPAVACFDTAFHTGMPQAATTYALPAAWNRRWGLRRYGFHGLSHAWASTRAAELGGGRDGDRVVTCHLGAGASLAAVAGGRSVDTTMGFTPLEGLVMATRSGSVDPGLLLWLLQRVGVAVDDLADALEHRSGLAGLAGTGDMRAVVEGAEAGAADATLALDVYVHRVRAGIAAMAAALGGLDALVFTGGVGEGAPLVRRQVAEGLAFLGVTLDADANRSAVPDAEVTGDGAAAVYVVAAREDRQVASEVRRVLGR
jgi:acetate kinase